MRQIRINHLGAGEWIMQRCGGEFRPDMDHSIALYDGDEIQGGFVFNTYLGNAIAVHNGGIGPGWCSRDLLVMVFHYAFRQLNCSKLLAPCRSDNHRAIAIDMRAGFQLEAVIKNAIEPGVHLVVLTMSQTNCRWLDIPLQQYLPGRRLEKADG